MITLPNRYLRKKKIEMYHWSFFISITLYCKVINQCLTERIPQHKASHLTGIYLDHLLCTCNVAAKHSIKNLWTNKETWNILSELIYRLVEVKRCSWVNKIVFLQLCPWHGNSQNLLIYLSLKYKLLSAKLVWFQNCLKLLCIKIHSISFI